MTLRQSEQDFRAIFDRAPSGIAVVESRTGRFLKINDSYCNILGYTQAEMLSLDFQTITHPDDLQEDMACMAKLVRGEINEFAIEKRYTRKDGSVAWVNLKAVPLWCQGQEPHTHLAMVEDITVRKRAEQRLREATRFTEQIIASAAEGIVVYDRDLRLNVWNSSMERMTGMAARQVLGQCAPDVLPYLMEHGVDELLAEALAGRTVSSGDIPFHVPGANKSGWVASTYGPHLDHDGRIIGVIGIIRDVTERKRAEAALRESEERHRTVLRTAMDGFWLISPEGRLLEVNEAYCRMSGYSEQELLSMRVCDLEANESAEETAAHIEEVRASGEARFESRHRRKDGTVFDVEVSVQYRPGYNGWFAAFVQDITESKRAEQTLRESEARLAAAQRIAHIGSWEWDPRNDDARWSEETFRLFGIPPAELKQHRATFLDMIHPDDRRRVAQALEDAALGTRPYDLDYRIRRTDGSQRVIHAQAEVIRGQDGRPVKMRGTVHDVTERKHVEESLRQSEQRLRLALKAGQMGSWEWDIQAGRIVFNERKYELLGLPPQEGEVADELFFSRVHPDDVAGFRQAVDRSFADGEFNHEFRIVRDDGDVCWLASKGQPVSRQ